MALDLLSSEILTFIGYLAPFLMTFVVILLSIFNGQPLKGIIYLAGVLILSVICVAISKIINAPIPKESLYVCRMFTAKGLLDFSTPSISTAIMTFTAVYIILPLIQKNQFNSYLFAFLGIMIIANSASRVYAGCTTLLKGVMSGFLIGLLFAMGYIVALKTSSDNADAELLLFSESLTNGQVCSRPSSEKFKCKVYKNGELIG